MQSLKLNPDLPATDDQLGRGAFAESLADWIVSPPETSSLVVGLEGDWGTGKSTLLHLLTDSLDSRPYAAKEAKPVVVNINLWLISGADAFMETLLTQLAAGISFHPVGKSLEKTLEISERMLAYASLLKYLRHLKLIPGLGTAGHWADALGELFEKTGERAEKGKEAAKSLKEVLPKLDLEQKKKELGEAIESLGRPLIVVLDDIDRLTDVEIKAVFQSLKVVADFPRTVYLVAYDVDVVSRALGGGNVELGASYLEKVVQVNYPVPHLFRDELHAFLCTKRADLDKLLALDPLEAQSQRLADATRLVAALCDNPRQVTRILNRYGIAAKALHADVCLGDLLALEALAVRFPTVWAQLPQRPEDFLGIQRETGKPDAKVDGPLRVEFEAKLQHWGVTSDTSRSAIADLLDFLFKERGRASAEAMFARKRVASPVRYEAYFTRASPTGLDSMLLYETILQSQSDFRQKVRELPADQWPAFLRRCESVIEERVTSNAARVRAYLIDWIVSLPAGKAVEYALMQAASACVVALLRVDAAGSPDRAHGAGALPLPFVADVAEKLWQRSVNPRAQDESVADRLEADARRWVQVMADMLVADLASGVVPEADASPRYLALYARLHDEQACRRLARALARSEDGAGVLLGVFGGDVMLTKAQRTQFVWDIDELSALLEQYPRAAVQHMDAVAFLKSADLREHMALRRAVGLETSGSNE